MNTISVMTMMRRTKVRSGVKEKSEMKLTPLVPLVRTPSVLVLLMLCAGLSISVTNAQESHQFKDGQEKLGVFREVLKTRGFKPTTQPRPEYCDTFLIDLLANKAVQPIEPVVQAMSENDPGLKKWRRCDGNHRAGIVATNPRIEYDGIGSLLGGPPYRYFRIDMDGRQQSGKEDVLYHEKYLNDKGVLTGKAAYSWVDLERCVIRQVFSVESTTPPPWENVPSALYRIHMPVLHMHKPLLMELTPYSNNSGVSNYRFTVTALNDKLPATICAWDETNSPR